MNQDKTNKAANDADFNPFDPTGMLKEHARRQSWIRMGQVDGRISSIPTPTPQATGAMLDAWLTSFGLHFAKALKDST